MEKNQCVHGFQIKNVRPLPEAGATLWEMEHLSSGAGLLWLERGEENKTFAIAFRTVPEDDTGVFHILEHSVLCGSEKYPVKEPFVALMKGSLQTYLNALTFPDKTVYPVSSRNEKDYVNLMRVYMDAVLHPRIYQCPEIFQQEGWHYDFGPEGKVSYQGVVLNEMKGAFSDPGAWLQRAVNRALFPDSCYGHVFGGDPACIPELTCERFLDCHRRFYHPSNACIFLDGNVDIAQVLSILDGEYLSAYTRLMDVPQIPLQQAVRPPLLRVEYPCGPQESTEGRARLALGYVLGEVPCQVEVAAVQVLSDVLCGSNDAPLKRRLLAEGLARDVQLQLNDNVRQPYGVLEVLYLDEDKVEEVRQAVTEELSRLAKEGLDHGQIQATLANMEFQMRERLPQGLNLGLQMLGSWVYGSDPAAELAIGSLFAELNAALEQGYFEALLERVFLRSSHCCAVVLVPVRETTTQEQELPAWTTEQRAALLAQQEKRLVWQRTPDSPAALAALPRLTLQDLPAQPVDIPTGTEDWGGVPALVHPIATGGVDYVNLYFEVSDFAARQLSTLAFLCSLLGALDTRQHSAMDLQRLAKLHLGSLHCSIEAYGKPGEPEHCRTFFCVSFSTVAGKLEQAASLVAEVLTGTVFGDRQKIHALLRQLSAAMEQGIAMGGISFAMSRVNAGCTAEGAVREHIGGITYIQWLKTLEGDYDQRAASFQTELEQLCQRIITRGRLTVSITGQDALAAETLEKGLLCQLPDAPRQTLPQVVTPLGVRREGIVVNGDVSFAVMGGNVRENPTGLAPVLGKAVTLGYLWGAVRVQGGAYGTGFGLGDSGCASFYSYRDPSAVRSLGYFRQTPAFLRQLPGMTADLTDFIIGAVAESEPHLLPGQQGKAADGLYWRGISYAQRCQRRRALLAAAPAQLAGFADALGEMLQRAGICVIGSRQHIDACGSSLENVLSL